MLLISRKRLFYYSIFATMCVAVVPLTVFLSDTIGRYESSKYFVQELKSHIKPGEAVGAESDYRRGVVFYYGSNDVIDIHQHDTMTKFFNRNERVWGIMKDKNLTSLYTDKLTPYPYPTYVIYKSGKRDIVTNKIPDDGHYLEMRKGQAPI